jgi:hypothetical protein
LSPQACRHHRGHHQGNPSHHQPRLEQFASRMDVTSAQTLCELTPEVQPISYSSITYS